MKHDVASQRALNQKSAKISKWFKLASNVKTKGCERNRHKQGLCVHEMARVMLYCPMWPYTGL